MLEGRVRVVLGVEDLQTAHSLVGPIVRGGRRGEAAPIGHHRVVGFICEVKDVIGAVITINSGAGSVDALNSHQWDATSVQASRLALDIVEVMQDLELIVTHVRGGLHSALLGRLAVVSGLVKVVGYGAVVCLLSSVDSCIVHKVLASKRGE